MNVQNPHSARSRAARAPVWGMIAAAAAVLLGSCDNPAAPVDWPEPVPTTVSLDPGHLLFSSIGTTAQLQAIVLDQEGVAMPGAAVTWTSLDESVATVSADGVVASTGQGATRVRVAAGRAGAAVDVVVDQLADSLELSVTVAVLEALGDTLRVRATVRDAAGTGMSDAAVAWLVGDTTVATVTPDGLLASVGPGETVLVVSVDGLVRILGVEVRQTPGSLEVGPDPVRVDALGDTVRLSAIVRDAGGAAIVGAVVVWISSDTTVATVSDQGLIRAVRVGSATVTAASGNALHDTPVEVRQVVASLAIAPDSIALADPGDSATLTALALDALGSPIPDPPVVWTSSDEDVVTVDAAGHATAVGTGVTTVSAASGGHTASVTARVRPELTLEPGVPTTLTSEVASSVALAVRVDALGEGPFEGATVSWGAAGGGSISSATVLTSDANGFAGATWVLGTGAGPQTATATIATRGHSISVDFSATALAGPATAAFVLADSVLLSGAGETAFFGPTFLDEYGNPALVEPLDWTSLDPSVATVSPEGLLTAVAQGATYVTSALGAWVDSVLVTVVPRGAITVTFDDGWLTTYDVARPVMEEFGLAGNIGVYTQAIEQSFPAYMSLADLHQLHDEGWSMVSHTVTHDSLTTLSDLELDSELRSSQQWLVDQGFERAANIFIAPYHDFGPRERIAASEYYEASRGVSSNSFVPDSLVFWRPENPYEITGIDVGQLPYTTSLGRENLRALLQRTVDEGRFLDVVVHQVPADTLDDFRAMVAIIDEFRDRVLPYHLLYPRFARPVF